MKRFDPLQVLEMCERHAITRLHMVPTMLNAVLTHSEFEKFNLTSVDTFVYASAPMPVEQLRVILERVGPKLMQVYTLTESAVISTLLRKEDHVVDGSEEALRRLASCGREALDVQLRIVDDEGREQAAGEVGEIALLSPGNMAEYWRQPSLTAEVIRDGWVHSRDLAYRDEAGYVFLVDRKDDKIVTGGYNVYPREVEEVLYAHPAVHEAAVVGIPDDRWGETVAAFVALRPNAICTVEELERHCAKNLAGYKKPRRIEFRESLPKSTIGKISRNMLREPFWTDRSRRIG